MLKYKHLSLFFQWTARGALGIFGHLVIEHVQGAFKKEEGAFSEILEMNRNSEGFREIY